MDAPLFLKNKVLRQLTWHGLEYTFYRYKKDKFQQPTQEVEATIKVHGIYHENNGYISERVGDATIVHSKKSPMIMTLAELATGVQTQDMVDIGVKKYKVVGILDVQNYGVVYDISLEEVI